MKKIIYTFIALAALTFMSSDTALAATTANDGTHVMIMTHLCDSTIKTVQDFENMESGKTPVANLGNDVLHCPTTGLSNSTSTLGTVAAPRTTYDFSVQSGSGAPLTLQENGVYEQHKACESDLNVDVDGDGKISTSTCLDISHYKFHIPDGGSSIVNIQETQAPTGFHFGTLRFTPVILDGNNDSETLTSIDPASGRIDVNVTPDKDGMVMLHIYQFMNLETVPPPVGTTTPPTATSTGNGSISGTFFDDLNQNGIMDTGEKHLAGFTVNLYKDMLYGTLVSSVMTDSNGMYTFNNLPDGTYAVEEIEQTGWSQYNDDYRSLNITGAENLTNIDFANTETMSSDNGDNNDDQGDTSGHVGWMRNHSAN